MTQLLAQLVLRFFALLPLPLNHALGWLLGSLLYYLPVRLNRVTRTNIRLCFPDRDRRWQRRLARASLRETGKTFTELGPLWFWPKPRLEALVREVEDEDIAWAVLAKQRGMLICTPHMGSWELSSLYGCSRFTMTILYRPPRMAELDTLIRGARERFGARMVPAGAQAVKQMYQALARGETVGMLPDQEPRRGAGQFVPFFGIPALTMVLLARFARKSGAGVVFAFMQRLPRGRGYRMRYLRAGDAIYDPDPAVAGREINRMVETCIQLDPAQYMWSYRRFRHRPPGQPRLY